MELGLNTFKLRVFDFRIWGEFNPLFILIWGELVLLTKQVIWLSMSTAF